MSTLKKVKVENMLSSRGNREIPNQFIIHVEGEGRYFQSYKSLIAFRPYALSGNNKIVLDLHYWDYSTTTGKYRNQFLGEEKKETQKKITSGEYELANLN